MISIDILGGYKQNIYNNDLLIKNIFLVESQIIHVALVLLILFQNHSKTLSYDFELLIFEINIE